ncbi:UNVERIFIED_CONTAM: hypothetical protein Sradi_7172300 [Sesamum radiatum]|uniref:Secreted protein n=1 Tax=Sesamum radiatum TaxID=300843 RepID=A0AAW2ITW6_SESRA
MLCFTAAVSTRHALPASHSVRGLMGLRATISSKGHFLAPTWRLSLDVCKISATACKVADCDAFEMDSNA